MKTASAANASLYAMALEFTASISPRAKGQTRLGLNLMVAQTVCISFFFSLEER
jgi:hypothetical protein